MMTPNLLILVHVGYALGLMLVLRNSEEHHELPKITCLLIPVTLFCTGVVSYGLGELSTFELITSYLLVGVTYATMRYYEHRRLSQNKEPTFGMFVLYLVRSLFWPISKIRPYTRWS